jgi:hypothetical protein
LRFIIVGDDLIAGRNYIDFRFACKLQIGIGDANSGSGVVNMAARPPARLVKMRTPDQDCSSAGEAAMFGTARAMAGTNMPADGLFAPPRQIIDAIIAAVARLSSDERAAVLKTNAEHFYRI